MKSLTWSTTGRDSPPRSVLATVYHYQSVEYKVRSQDDRDAWVYTIGLRDDDFMRWGTRVDLRTTFKITFSRILVNDLTQSMI